MKGKIEIEVSESAILKWIGTISFGWIIMLLGLIFVVPFLAFEAPLSWIIVGISGIAVLFIITVFSARFKRKEE